MKKFLFLITTIFVVLILPACNEEQVLEHDNSNTAYTIYSSNPYEWVGVYHNEILSAILDTFDYTNYNGTWPDNDVIDTISLFVDEYVVENYNNYDTTAPAIYNYPVAEHWISMIDDSNELLDSLNKYLDDSDYSALDKQYAQSINDLVDDMLNTTLSDAEISSKIDSLESVILSQDWGDGDIVALMGIALLKHSFNYHTTQSVNNDKGNSNNRILGMSSLQKAAIVATDYSVGAGIFLGGTSASGGLAAGAALWGGMKAGVAASGAILLLGGLLDWW